MVIINGMKRPETAGVRLSDYLSSEGYDSDLVAVECNGGVISKREYAQKKILDGEIIEIVSFVGGS